MDAGQSLLAPSSNQEPNGAVPAVPLPRDAVCEPTMNVCRCGHSECFFFIEVGR